MSNEIMLNKNEVLMNSNTLAGFEAMQRYAIMLSKSKLIPLNYRGSENIADIMIALDIARRLNVSDIMVMQNLYIVHGQPAWSAKFLIATFNRCGRFTSIKYKFTGKKGEDSYGCIAYATEKETNEKIESPEITISMAKSEGWYGKNGSKWKTMPDLMLMYRSASMLVRTHAPDLSFGFYTEDELKDFIPMRENANGEFVPVNEEEIKPLEIDAETGEVLEVETKEEQKEEVKEPKKAKQQALLDTKYDDAFYSNN